MHKLFARQLRRKAGIASEEAFARALREVDTLVAGSEISAETAGFLKALPEVFSEVEKSYVQIDRDLELRRRSLEISSQELLDANSLLRADSASRQRAYDSLLDAANRMLAGSDMPVIARGEADIEALSERMSDLVRERAAAQLKLVRSEERLRIANAVAKMVVIDLDLLTDTLTFSDSPEWLRGPIPVDTGKYPLFKDQIHPDDRARFLANRQEAINTLEPRSQEFRVVRTDGKELWIQSRLRVFAGPDGKGARLVAAMLDISERKLMEDELRVAKEQAEAASSAKSQFLANMSHEIRTPMNGVLGMAELLIGTSLTAKQRHFAETVRRSGEALLHVINDILDFSKIEAGKMELDLVEFDLREIAGDVVQLLAEGAHSKGIELNCRISADVPDMIVGDPTRVRQVLLNLVGNAVKFTDSGEVVVDVGVSGVDTLRFDVRDTGIGITPETQSRLFQAFSQADGSMSRRYGGTGLGLVICKELVALMGGDLDVSSIAGKGTTFTFSIGYAPATAREILMDATQLYGHRVLIVDDNETNRHLINDHATVAFGMVARVAADGARALSMLTESAAAGTPYEFAIIDHRMPGMDGEALAVAVRANPSLAELRQHGARGSVRRRHREAHSSG
jgi:signal transduction histidine kinase